MSVISYIVKKGDTLWDLAREYASSIPGNDIKAKVKYLAEINGIRDPDLIITGQKLYFSGDGNNFTSSTPASSVVTIDLFGLQAQDTSGRAMYATWSWSKDNTDHYTVRWRYYADGVWWIGSESDTSGASYDYCQSTYSAPSNASKVRVSVRPISKTYKNKNNEENYYWTASYCTEKEYDFSNNPPSVPSTPVVEIKNLVLTASIDNIDANELNAPLIEFDIVKDNVIKYRSGSATINTSTNYVSYLCTVEAGANYKVRCRSVRGSLVSAWSEYSSNSGTQPAPVSAITACKANKYSENSIGVYLEWTSVANAQTYDIEYTTNQSFFDGTDGTNTVSGVEFNHYEMTGLRLGQEYFFRVRANNQYGVSAWSEIKSIIIGKKPSVPTTWSSTTTAIVGEVVNLYWVHNSEDESSETYAELWISINGQPTSKIIKKSTDESEKDKTSCYPVDTSAYTSGTQITWKVRTKGIADDYGEWSTQRTIDVYAEPTLTLGVTDLQGNRVDTLTAFPFYISAVAGPATQSPISYQLKIVANEFYETVDDTGQTKMVNAGDEIFSKYYDITTQLNVTMTAAEIDLESGITYRIDCSATMNTGLTASISHEFSVSWGESSYRLDAEITVDEETLTATIQPFSKDPFGSLVEGITLAVYRREFDGSFVELGKGISNSNNTHITDPHPALNYARYRIVGTKTATGAISFYDVPGYPVNGKGIVIQWDEEWSEYNTSDEYSVEKPPWSGSMLRLPYNVDVSDSSDPDVTFVKYAGRKRPVSYYGTQEGVTATWNTDIPKSDLDTIYALRRLAIWKGDVYVRESSGSGYWANIKVTFNQRHNEVVVPVSLSVTRVEGGI